MAEMFTLGIDEVGRGAWAGPVVAAAVLWPAKVTEGLIRDSKTLSPTNRHQANRLIRQSAAAIGLGFVTAAEVDAHGLSWAVQTSGVRALQDLEVPIAETGLIELDGSYDYLSALGYHARATVRADAIIPAVSAASIVAKVARDNLMRLYGHMYPGYSFDQHKGYGTAAHQSALVSLGVCGLHRRSVKPVMRYQSS